MALSKIPSYLQNEAALTSGDLPAGSVLQVVQNVVSGNDYLSTSSSGVDTQLTASITPSSTSSKILIQFEYMIGTSTTSNSMVYARIKRNGSIIKQIGQVAGNVVSNRAVQHVFHSYLDSPSTTSSTTYTLNIDSIDGATIYVGAWGYSQAWRSDTVVTLTEIAG